MSEDRWEKPAAECRERGWFAICAGNGTGVEMVWHGDRLVRKDAGPTLRIYDATGCVLAEGPVRAEQTEKGARLHFAGQCCATGTADCYAVYANGKQVTWGQTGRGVRPIRMTQALLSGLYLTISLDVTDASEEQLQALGLEPAKQTAPPMPKLAKEGVVRLADLARQWEVLPLPPARSRLVFCGEKDGACYDVATLTDDRVFSCECGSTDPMNHADNCALLWQYRAVALGAHLACGGWGAMQSEAQRTLLGASCVALLSWACQLWDRRHDERRQREASLVALANAAPDGLNANGWRAASIAVAESFSRLSERDRPHPEEWGQRLAMTIAHPPKEWPFPGSWMQAALAKGLDAYQRAIAPHRAPAPERRRGGKAVRLTVDDGRDDD